MSSRRDVQISETIAHLAAEYLARESNVGALLTVTHAEMSPDLAKALIFLSILPQTAEDETLRVIKRLRSDLRDYIKQKSFLHPLPVVDFAIDYGEKNRQRIDELTR